MNLTNGFVNTVFRTHSSQDSDNTEHLLNAIETLEEHKILLEEEEKCLISLYYKFSKEVIKKTIKNELQKIKRDLKDISYTLSEVRKQFDKQNNHEKKGM